MNRKGEPQNEMLPSVTLLEFSSCEPMIYPMIHENLSQSIENLSSRMIAIRDSL